MPAHGTNMKTSDAHHSIYWGIYYTRLRTQNNNSVWHSHIEIWRLAEEAESKHMPKTPV